MTEVMFAFQMTGPQERKAMEAWISDKGEDLDIVAQLPKMKVGRPHVWSPQWLQVSKPIAILKKRTYDASATPEFGSSEAARELTPVDVVAIKEAMREMISQAEADDPTALRREIGRLKKELTVAQSSKPKAEVIEREVHIITDEQMKALNEHLTDVKGITDELSAWKADTVLFLISLLDGKIESLQKTAFGLSAAITEAKPSKPVPVVLPSRVINKPISKPTMRQPEKFPTSESGDITRAQQRILDVIAWLESVALYNPKRVVVASLAGRSVKSSQWTGDLGVLRTQSLIDYPDSDSICFTEAGRSAAHQQSAPLTTEELQEAVLARLPRAQARILEILIDNYPEPVNRDELAAQAGRSIKSSQWTGDLGNLRSLGVIDYPNSNQAVALPVLFLE